MANNKRTVQDLAESMAKRHRYSKVKSESFIRGALSIIKGALEKENYVKVKGLGTFKLVTVNSRESVNVNTGERIEISEHQRLTFTPDKSLKERVNRPFEQFQTVVIEDDDLDFIEEFEEDETAETIVSALKSGRCVKTVRFETSIDLEKITAKFTNGIVIITIPKLIIPKHKVNVE